MDTPHKTGNYGFKFFVHRLQCYKLLTLKSMRIHLIAAAVGR